MEDEEIIMIHLSLTLSQLGGASQALHPTFFKVAKN